MTVVDFTARKAFDLLLDRDRFEALRGEYERQGAGRPSRDVATFPQEIEKSLSKGTDQRMRQGVADGIPADHWPESTIGFVSAAGTCTGTLIGNRLVLTAAHCVILSNGAHTFGSFAPRRDESTGTVLTPFGSPTMIGGTYPSAYTLNDCHTTYTDACVPYDLYVMILPASPWPSPGPGYMGYAYGSDADLNGWTSYHAGYPVCSTGGPVPCTDRTLYRDKQGINLKPCTPFEFAQPATQWPYDGEHGEVRQRCDSSSGQSGGSIWAYDFTVVSQLVWNLCPPTQICATTYDYASSGPRVTAASFSWFSYLRSAYP